MQLVRRAPRAIAALIVGALAFWATEVYSRLPLSLATEAASATGAWQAASPGRPLKVLFLGQEQQPHPAGAVFQLLAAPLARRGIQLSPAFTPAALADRLSYYDGLILYGNQTALAPDQEKALIDFVEGGKGVVAIHSAIEMFGGSARYGSLIGGQGKTQGGGDFTAEIVAPTHPAMQGVTSFASWDESVALTGVCVGADAGQGSGVLHGLRSRSADVEQPRLPDAHRKGNRVVGRGAGAPGVSATEDP